MIDAYVKDVEEKEKLFCAVDNFSSVKKKADWAIKWVGRWGNSISLGMLNRCFE